jgi:hypothetical protein
MITFKITSKTYHVLRYAKLGVSFIIARFALLRGHVYGHVSAEHTQTNCQLAGLIIYIHCH